MVSGPACDCPGDFPRACPDQTPEIFFARQSGGECFRLRTSPISQTADGIFDHAVAKRSIDRSRNARPDQIRELDAFGGCAPPGETRQIFRAQLFGEFNGFAQRPMYNPSNRRTGCPYRRAEHDQMLDGRFAVRLGFHPVVNI